MADEKISALISAGALAGIEPLAIVQGGVTKKTTVQAVANLKATPNLQQVTTAGASTTNSFRSSDGFANKTIIDNGTIEMTTGGADVTIDAALAVTAYTAQLPNKATGTYIFAMTDDITGGTLSLEVNSTPNGDQTLLNLVAGTNITLTDDGIGSVTIDASGGGGGDVYLANDQTFTGENTFNIASGTKEPIIITKGGNGAGLKVTKTSGSGDAIEVANGSVSIADETASTIAHFDGSKRLKSLATSTYPSLTELSYVKGVTSAIQTQLNALKIEEINLQDIGTALPASTYTVVLDAKYARTINELTVDAGAGTCTLTMNINGTPVTGISSVSVSTTEATYTATAANAIAIGDIVTIVTTSNSGLDNLQITVRTTR